VNAGTKSNFERLSDRFLKDVDEWFLHQHGIRYLTYMDETKRKSLRSETRLDSSWMKLSPKVNFKD